MSKLNAHTYIFLYVLLTLGLSIFLSPVASAENVSDKGKLKKPFVFMVYQGQEPPFVYIDQSTQEYKGIVPDIFRLIAAELDLALEFKPASRNMVEPALLKGTADGAWLVPEWSNNPEKFIFSTPVLQHSEYLYSMSAFVGETPKQWLQDKSICLRQHYAYPSLEPYIDDGVDKSKGIAQRLDVSSQVPLLKLLVTKRCDYIYMTAYRAQWMKSYLQIEQPLYSSPTALAKTQMKLALSEKWQPMLLKFNTAIQKMRTTGLIESIVQRNMLVKSNIY